MSFAFLPLYTGDYLRDTRHLTPLKHGVYLLLLMHCWDQKGPLPLDEQECAGIANCRSADEVESLRYVLQRFFVRLEDGWYNHRMQREVERSSAISAARSDAGRKGYEAKAKQVPSKSQASAKQVPLPPPPPLSPPPSLSPKSKTLASRDESRSADESPVIERLPLNDGTYLEIQQSIVDELSPAYPAVDVPATLREIKAWCVTNPKNRKTRSGALRFVNAWLKREQDRAPVR